MALYAFDGTWNEAKDDDQQYRNTNVWRFHAAYTANSGNQRGFYWPGVGTRLGVVGKIIGGVFGAGEVPRLEEAYDQLCAAWAAGDRVIDIVGFSRGAATTLDFCHLIESRGIRGLEPKPQIGFLGVWDVVASFGLANLGATDLNIGHHISLPKARLQYAFHALALDERRPSFTPTRLPGAYEVWFRGAHSDIGGGNGNRGLNDIALKWMMSKAAAAGLPITAADIAALQPNPNAPPHFASPKLPLDIRLVAAVDRRHYSVEPVDGCKSPPGTCGVETPEDEQKAREVGADGLVTLPPEVRARISALWQAADSTARSLGFTLDGVHDPLLSLIQGRIPLVMDADALKKAGDSVVRLVSRMAAGAKRRDFHQLNAFFLTEALHELKPLFPFTD